MFDAKMNLMEESSGVLQVQDPNERKTLDALDLHVPKGGYLHTYVTNSGTQKVNFDKFTVLRLQGKTREIFHYYPYGLEIHGINATQRKYKYRYSGKELQTAEWGQDGHGIELHDFGSRFYQATTGRWHVPDPAEQFHNPYLAMGNNPVVYVDPDGEFVHIIVGAAIGGTLNWALNGANFNAEGLGYFGVGALAGGLAAGVGAGVSSAIAGNAAAGGGFAAGFTGSATLSSTGFVAGAASGGAAGVVNGLVQGTGNGLLGGENIGDSFDLGLDQAWKQGISGAVIGGVIGGIRSTNNGGGFFENGTKRKLVVKNSDIRPVKQRGNQNCLACAGESIAKSEGIKLSQEQIRQTLGGDPNLHPLDNNKFGEYLGTKIGAHYGIRDAGQFNKSDIFKVMNKGSHVVLSRQSSSGIGHALVLRKAVKKSFNFASSVPTTFYKFSGMNPATGTFERIEFGDLKYRMLQWTPW